MPGDLGRHDPAEMPDGEVIDQPALFGEEDLPAVAPPPKDAQSIYVHFEDLADIPEFARLIGQPVTSQTRWLRFPPLVAGERASPFAAPVEPAEDAVDAATPGFCLTSDPDAYVAPGAFPPPIPSDPAMEWEADPHLLELAHLHRAGEGNWQDIVVYFRRVVRAARSGR